MHFFLGLSLALCALSLVSPAPIQGSSKDMQSPAFQDALENGYSLISKIVNDVPAVYKSWIHTESLSLDASDPGHLQYMKDYLSLPTTPALTPFLDKHMLGAHLSQIAEGLRLHQTVLKVLSKLVHAKSERVDELLHDIRDLLLQVHKMQSLRSKASAAKTPAASAPKTPATSESQLQADMAPRLKDEFTSQVAAHLAMHELKRFSQGVSVSLRAMISIYADTQTPL